MPTNTEFEARTLPAADYVIVSDLGTVQTGDSYARLGAPAGASVSADVAAVKAQTAAIETDTQDLQTQVGVDGAGLTALPWNAAWDAEVQSEATDALNAYDPPTTAELNTALSGLTTAGSGALTVTVTVNDEGGDPLDGVETWITTDSAGTDLVAGTLSTNALGVATYMLDAGTYYLWRQLSGYNFTNPIEMVVA
jgi:hypothetical protein